MRKQDLLTVRNGHLTHKQDLLSMRNGRLVQEQDLLTVRAHPQPLVSSRKQQRSIRDFFASPPAVPLAKRFKAQSSALPDSAQKAHITERTQQHSSDEARTVECDSAAHAPGNHDISQVCVSTSGRCTDAAANVQLVCCFGDAWACGGASSHHKHGQKCAQSEACQPVGKVAVTPTLSQSKPKKGVQVSGTMHEQKQCASSSSLEICGNVDMEDKENICCVTATA